MSRNGIDCDSPWQDEAGGATKEGRALNKSQPHPATTTFCIMWFAIF